MNLFENVHESWIPLIHSLAYKEPMDKFLSSLREMSFQPTYEQIFRVFQMPVKDIKVVILGQDPYPIPRAAVGLAYAVNKFVNKEPTVLSKIKQEIFESQVEVNEELTNPKSNKYNTLEHLENQGVFLLNTTLTVETGKAGSHEKHWKEFTETVISFISENNPCIWLLWGTNAKSKSIKIINPLIVKGYDEDTIEEIPVDKNLNYIIPGNHPATSKGFSNNGFYFTNIILKKKSLNKITW